MGLIKMAGAAIGAVKGGIGTTASSLWTDYFESGDMSNGVLMKRAKRVIGEKSQNAKGDPNIITSGSGIDVQENQCMLVVENGKIIELCMEAGRYTYDESSAPSLLTGNNKGLRALLDSVVKQTLAGGQRTNTQRVYFINMGEIQGFKWGSGNISFQHVERDLATDAPVWQCSTTLKGNGVYSIHVVDPLKFFQVWGSSIVGSDGDGRITAAEIDTQIKAEVIGAIRQGIGKMSQLKIAYTDIAGREMELINEVNTVLGDSWSSARGVSIFKIAINMMDPDEESKVKISKYQETKGFTDPSMLAAHMGIGQTEAMVQAAKNSAGAMQGFAGVGMFGNMNQANGANLASMMQMGQQQNVQQPMQQQPVQQQPIQQAAPQNTVENWVCQCGAANAGKFCMECGTPRAQETVCSKCGWKPIEGMANPKFCPECGGSF